MLLPNSRPAKFSREPAHFKREQEPLLTDMER
jgi:hypothetical protein